MQIVNNELQRWTLHRGSNRHAFMQKARLKKTQARTSRMEASLANWALA